MTRQIEMTPGCGRQTLLRQFKSSLLGRQLKRWWLRPRDKFIREGVGTGLRFNAAHGNPDYLNGDNELPVQQALAANLHPGDVFYDIGANVGFFTVIGASLVTAQGQVIAFEPVTENAAAVRHNCQLNDFNQVQVNEVAVSNETGRTELRLAHYAGGAALASADPPPDLKGVITVPVITVDELITKRQLPPPAVVKIDVEGAEVNVLRGMRDTLRQYRPVVIYELDDGDAQKLAKKAKLCQDFLQAADYQIRRLEDSYPNIDWLVAHYVAKPKKQLRRNHL